MTQEPRDDPSFPTLVKRWRALGWDKDEGIGLLHKEGGYVEFFAVLVKHAPRTLACVLHADNPAWEVEGDLGFRELLIALKIADVAARRARLEALEFYEPVDDLDTRIRALEPPMEAKFARRLIDWIDMATNIEVRSTGDSAGGFAPPGGQSVEHPVFGHGVIRKIEPGSNAIATIDFDTHGEKRIALRFVKML